MVSLSLHAQNSYRIADPTTIGWYVYVGTFKLSPKWDLHTEYQWRRAELIKSWMQSQVRTALHYNINKQAQVGVGYSHILTYPYGDYPIASKGYPAPEHRIYQQLVIKGNVGIIETQSRFRLEQRWGGQLKPITDRGVESWLYTNRIRYMFRANIPLKGKTIADKTPYAALSDEIFCNFGKNVKYNIFDQNRLYLLLGYKFNHTFKLEGGFLSQIQQKSSPIIVTDINATTYKAEVVSNQNVIQYNNGVFLNAIFNFDLTKKEKK